MLGVAVVVYGYIYERDFMTRYYQLELNKNAKQKVAGLSPAGRALNNRGFAADGSVA